MENKPLDSKRSPTDHECELCDCGFGTPHCSYGSPSFPCASPKRMGPQKPRGLASNVELVWRDVEKQFSLRHAMSTEEEWVKFAEEEVRRRLRASSQANQFVLLTGNARAFNTAQEFQRALAHGCEQPKLSSVQATAKPEEKPLPPKSVYERDAEWRLLVESPEGRWSQEAYRMSYYGFTDARQLRGE